MSEGWGNFDKDFNQLRLDSVQNSWNTVQSHDSRDSGWNNKGVAGVGHGQSFGQSRGSQQQYFRGGRGSSRDGFNSYSSNTGDYRHNDLRGRGGSRGQSGRRRGNAHYNQYNSSKSSIDNNSAWNSDASTRQASGDWSNNSSQQNSEASPGWGTTASTSTESNDSINATENNAWNTVTTKNPQKVKSRDKRESGKWNSFAANHSNDRSVPGFKGNDRDSGWSTVAAPNTSNSSSSSNQWNTVASTTQQAPAADWNNNAPASTTSSTSGGGGWDDTTESSAPEWGAVTLDTLGWSEKSKKKAKEAGRGQWQDGQHILAEEDDELKLKLFGTPQDHETMHTGINFDKYKDIPVEVKGENIPTGIVEFATSGLDRHLLENISYAHYTTPTPVQKHSVPIVMQGHDLMACAQTGSGKTAGFLFPILSALFSKGPLEDPIEPPVKRGYYSYKKVYPQALILAPTRELVMQIYKEAKKFCYRSYVRPCVAYGGVDIQQQLRLIDRGCHLLVATPGRLVDILERGRVSFQNIQYLVLDEADRMLDMGFEPQVRRIVEGEDMPPCENRQTLMFSATFPESIQALARDFLSEYVFLSVGRVGGATENITQRIELLKNEEKQDRLLQLLADVKASGGNAKDNNSNIGLTLIFTETKRMADTVCEFLNDNRLPATAIHGDRVQSEREAALDSFRRGVTPIMVATAVAARGLDIPNVTHVISYDLPNDVDDYVHRIGRTGRAGNTGLATAFFTHSNRFMARALVKVLQDAKQEVPQWLLETSKEVALSSSSTSPSFRSGGRRGGGGGGRRGFEGAGMKW